RQAHPETGQPLIMVEHTKVGGFVPLGAKLADGRPHPHAGTGFAVVRTHSFAADLSTRLNSEVRPPYAYLELLQLRYDGQTFAVMRLKRLVWDDLLPGTPAVGSGLGSAVPDGEDLLYGMTIRPANGKA